MGNTIRGGKQEHACLHTCGTIYLCIPHLHICKILTTACGKEKQRYLYWGRLLVYLHILLFWLEEGMDIHKHDSAYMLSFFCQSDYCRQFIPLPLLFRGLLPTSPRESLSWIQVRQKNKIKELRLWSPFDLPFNPIPVLFSSETLASYWTSLSSTDSSAKGE